MDPKGLIISSNGQCESLVSAATLMQHHTFKGGEGSGEGVDVKNKSYKGKGGFSSVEKQKLGATLKTRRSSTSNRSQAFVKLT